MGLVLFPAGYASLVETSQIQANTDPSFYDVLGPRFFVSLKAELR